MNFDDVKSITISNGDVKSLKINEIEVWKKQESYVFVPDYITCNCQYAKRSKKANVNVVTSNDVEKVTIDGKSVTYKNVSGKRRFHAEYRSVAAGKTFEIIAYDANGVASEIYTVVAE